MRVARRQRQIAESQGQPKPAICMFREAVARIGAASQHLAGAKVGWGIDGDISRPWPPAAHLVKSRSNLSGNSNGSGEGLMT